MIKYLLPLFILLLTSQAGAWLFFDPYIGYNRGQHQASRTQGIGYGARLGFEFGALYVAGDYAMSELQQGSLANVKYTEMSGVIGGDFRAYRIWFGQVLSTGFTYTSGTSTISYKGTGFKLGTGVLVTPKMYLNLELKTYDYTESSNAGVSTPVSEIGTFGLMSVSWAFN